MQGLTPETLAEGKRLYCAALNTSDPRGRLLGLEAWGQWVQKHMDGDAVLFALAAAESVGKLEQQLERAERVLTAPWSQEIVNELNAHQGAENRHPYTCGRSSCRRDHADSILRATRDGWRCDHCDYEQNWAHWHSAFSAVPNLALASLRAQLTAREQENRKGLDFMAQLAKGYLDEKTAAQAEVEQLKAAVRDLAIVRRSRPDAIGLFACTRCGGQGPTADRVGHDGNCEIGAALAPSQPPQTTETRG